VLARVTHLWRLSLPLISNRLAGRTNASATATTIPSGDSLINSALTSWFLGSFLAKDSPWRARLGYDAAAPDGPAKKNLQTVRTAREYATTSRSRTRHNRSMDGGRQAFISSPRGAYFALPPTARARISISRVAGAAKRTPAAVLPLA